MSYQFDKFYLEKNIKKVIAYIVFGIITTAINIVTYYLLFELLDFSNVFSVVISRFLAVLFAFFTNKIYVFSSKSMSVKVLFDEMSLFFSARIVTGLLDLIIMYISVDILSFWALPFKLLSNIIVVILNFIASQYLIFKRKQ